MQKYISLLSMLLVAVYALAINYVGNQLVFNPKAKAQSVTMALTEPIFHSPDLNPISKNKEIVNWKAEVALDDNGLWKYYHPLNDDTTATREELPLYSVRITLVGYNNQNQFVEGFVFDVMWPSETLYQENGQQPNLDPIDFEQLVNSSTNCKKFQLNQDSYHPSIDKETEKVDYFTLFDAWIIGLNTGNIYSLDYETAQKQCNFEFISYDPATNNLKAKLDASLIDVENNINYSFNVNFDGFVSVQGWKKDHNNLPEFGNIHIFNAGPNCQDGLNYATNNIAHQHNEKCDILNMLYVIGADSNYDIIVNNTASEFVANDVKIRPKNIDSNNSTSFKNQNYFYGYLTAPLDFVHPDFGVTFSMPKIGYCFDDIEDNIDWNPYIMFPTAGGYIYWTSYYSMKVAMESFPKYCSQNTHLSFHTPDGVLFESKLINGDVVRATSKMPIIYHYDPADITKTREIESVGDFTPNYTMPTSGNTHFTYDHNQASAKPVIDTTALSPAEWVKIYSPDGTLLFSGTYGDFHPAASGLYIIKTPKSIHKTPILN